MGTCPSGPTVNAQRMRPYMPGVCWRGGLVRGGLLYFFPFWSVPPQVCSVLVWSMSNAPGGTDHGRGINDSPSPHAKLAGIQKALAHNA